MNPVLKATIAIFITPKVSIRIDYIIVTEHSIKYGTVKISSSQICTLHICPRQQGSSEIRSTQIRVVEIPTAKVSVGEIYVFRSCISKIYIHPFRSC